MRRLGIGAARAECAAWGATIPEAFATAASQWARHQYELEVCATGLLANRLISDKTCSLTAISIQPS